MRPPYIYVFLFIPLSLVLALPLSLLTVYFAVVYGQHFQRASGVRVVGLLRRVQPFDARSFVRLLGAI